MVARGALIRAGAKWLDVRSCPVNPDVIHLGDELMKLLATTLLFAISTLFGNACVADLITIPGTGQFDSSLGTLFRVDVRFNPTARLTTSSTPSLHSHFFDPQLFQVSVPAGRTVDFQPIDTRLSGAHDHRISFSNFNWNGLIISNIPSVIVNSAPSHQHSVDFSPAVVRFDGRIDLARTETSTFFHNSQNHLFDIPQFQQTFTGSQLGVFLKGNPTPNCVIPGGVTSTIGSHNHGLQFSATYMARVNGVLQPVSAFGNILQNTTSTSTGSHLHTYNSISGQVLQTTFHFTPVPEPSSFSMLLLACLPALCRRRDRQ